MVESFIALASIFIGIVGAYLFGTIFKKYSLGMIANIICGVFGSIFWIKGLGRIGFDPKAIMQSGDVDLSLLTINLLISFLGGALAVWIAYHINRYFNAEGE